LVGLVGVLGASLTGCSRSDGKSDPPLSTPTTDATGTTSSGVRPAVEATGKVVGGAVVLDGDLRTYHLYVPDSLPKDEPVPLLVALHGGLGNGEQYRESSGFDGVAEANRFLVVFPDGSPVRAVPKGRVWNAGACCGRAAEGADDVDDVAFLRAMIDQISDEYRVDPDRVFAAGHSNGAMMSYRLACEAADDVAAIGLQAGALVVDPCRPSRPVSVLAIHGTADRNVPIHGGKGDRSVNDQAYPDPHLATDAFVAADDCPGDPSTTTDPDNADITTRTWTGCADGTEVAFVEVEGANHAWMGHPSTSRVTTNRIGPPYEDFDSSLAIWAFLAAHPRR
jgi:polyhydroxybutyrate depolymerase